MKRFIKMNGFKYLLAMCVAFIMSCSDSGLTPEQIAKSEQGFWVFSGIVLDVFGANDSTGKAELEGVKVSTSNNGKVVSTTTNKDGFFSIKELSPGSHSFKFEKEGYETLVNYSPANGQNQSIGKFYDVENAQIGLYRNDASISGKAYLMTTEDQKITVEGVPVRIDVGTSFMPRYRYARTDDEGKFSMDSLPRVSVKVEFEHFTNSGQRYAYQNSSGSELSKSIDLSRISSAGNFTLIPVFSELIQMISNNFSSGKFKGDTLTVAFDQELDESTLDITLGSTQLSWELSSDNKTLTVVTSGRLYAESDYSLQVSGKTVSGNNFSWKGYFTTSDAPRILTNSTMDSNGYVRDDVLSTETIELTFDREIAEVIPYDGLSGKVNVILDSNEVQIVPVVPMSNSTRNTLVGNLTVITMDDFLAEIDLPNFSLKGSISLVSSNVLDKDLSGLRDVPISVVINAVLSDSVASVIPVSSSYPDFKMSLDSTGKVVSIIRTNPYQAGNSYNFYIYGATVDGTQFSVYIPSFYIEEFANVNIVGGNIFDQNMDGLQNVPEDIEIEVELSEPVASVISSHPSYSNWKFTLDSNGTTVRVEHLQPFNPGSTYNFRIYGLTNDDFSFLTGNFDAFRIVDNQQVFLLSSNALDVNQNGLQDLPPDLVIKMNLSDSVASVIKNHPSYLDYDVTLGSDGREVTVTRRDPYSLGNNYSFSIYGVTASGENFFISHPSFRIESDPSVKILSSNALDTSLSGLYDLPKDLVVVVELTDSVASVVENHPSYPLYSLSLSSDGRRVTANRTQPYSYGGGYSFYIYGVTAKGKSFSMHHSTYYIEDYPSIYIKSSNALDTNLNGLHDLPQDLVVTVVLSDSVSSVIKNHSSYEEFNMVLGSDGRTVTVTRNEPYRAGTGYNFSIYGKKINGENFNLSHTTYYTKEHPEISIMSSNAADTNMNGLLDLPQELIITLQLSDSVVSVVQNHPSFTDYNMLLSANGRQVTITRNVPYMAGGNYSFTLYGVDQHGKSFSIGHPSFRIKDAPNIAIISSNAMDTNLVGLNDLPHNLIVNLTLSDSVASVIKNHPSYTDYDMALGNDGRQVTVTRRSLYSLGGQYRFCVYGLTKAGENFSTCHDWFYIRTQSVYIESSNALAPDGSGLTDLPANTVFTVELSDSIFRVDNNNGNWDMGLDATGKIVTVRRLTAYGGSSNNFFIQGLDQYGSSFSITHPTFYINVSAKVEWTNTRTANGNQASDVPLNDTLLFTFSEKIDFSEGYTISWTGFNGAYTTDTSSNGDTLKIIPLVNLPVNNTVGVYLNDLTTMNGFTFSEGYFYFDTELNRVLPGAVTGLAFDTTGLFASYITMTGVLSGGMPIEWDEKDSVDYYYVQALGTVAGNAGWINVETYFSNYSGGSLKASTTISNGELSALDAEPGRPMENGNRIQLRVVAVNDAGIGAPSANTLELADDISVGQVIGGSSINLLTNVAYSGVSWNNATGSPVVTYINITFPEWMDISTSPTISYSEAGGDAGAVATTGATTWEWLTRTTGRFAITVPATTDWTGDQVTISIEGVEDASDNASENNAYTIDAGSAWLGVTP